MGGRAPKPQGWASQMGRSMNTAIEGFGPEIVRGRDRPDAASRTGTPWPNSTDGVPEQTLYEWSYDTIEGSLDLDLPTGNLWSVHVRVSWSRTIAADPTSTGPWFVRTFLSLSDPETGVTDDPYVDAVVSDASGGFRADPLLTAHIESVGPFNVGWSGSYGHDGRGGTTTVTDGTTSAAISARWIRTLVLSDTP